MTIREQFRKETGGWVWVDDYPHEEYTDEYVAWLESKLEQKTEMDQVDAVVMRREEIPVGSIRRLLHWARYSIEGKGKPYTDGDGKNDIVAVENWTDKFE